MALSRIVRACAALVLATAASVLPGVSASAAPSPIAPAAHAARLAPAATAAVAAEHAATADVDDFSYASWDAVYDLSLVDGRARLHVTETLVARFPEFDQNRGIVRGLATSYENARIDTRVLSVTDGEGHDVPYETDEEDGLLLVLTGDDDFVRGLTTYVIEYEMDDVVLATSPKDPSTPAVDEFYWNLLPLDSTQPIERFDAEIRVDDAFADRLTGSTRCYQGPAGSTTACTLHGPQPADGGATFQVSAAGLPAGDGVTVAIGFESGTVLQPSARTPDPVADVGPLVAAIGAVAVSVASWLAVGGFVRRRRRATGIVIAQYDVPDSLPPLVAAAIIPKAKDVIPAEIVHLAVRGLLRIEEGDDPEQPRLRRLPGVPAPDELDAAALDALFEGADADGIVDLPSASETFAARMSTLTAAGATAAAERGFTDKARSRAAIILQWCAIVIALAGLGVGIWAVATGRLAAIPALVAAAFGVVLVGIAAFYSFSKHTVLTPEGARTLEYLEGVREFIRVAEEDRLRMLQSYRGAERREIDGAEVIHLYERLLPYAMLFGMEDEWGDVLERAYTREQHGASWIGDPTSLALRAPLAAFMSSSQSAATYTAPTTGSSSSGGSFGGGFSGGGGGGGFSGGR